MKAVVLGAGGIGGFIAGMLARSGTDVGVVARGAHLEAIRSRGLRIESDDFGTFCADVPVRADLREFGDVEFVLVAVKAHQLQELSEQLAPYAAAAQIVPLVNGIPFWYFPDRPVEASDPGGRLRALVPDSNVIGAVVHASGHVVEPGVVKQSGGALYPLGRPDGSADAKLEELAALFTRAGFTAPVSGTIRVDVWRKLMGNVAFNPISALNRARVGTILHDPLSRALVRNVMLEVIGVAAAAGVDVAIDVDARMKMAEHIADVKTSMLQDVEARRPLELEPIVGAVVEMARDGAVAVPHTDTLYALVKTLEAEILR